jgi:hypothetical protein
MHADAASASPDREVLGARPESYVRRAPATVPNARDVVREMPSTEFTPRTRNYRPRAIELNPVGKF